MHDHVDTRLVRATGGSTCIAYQCGWTPGGRTGVFRPRAPLDRHWGSLRNKRRAARECGVLDQGGLPQTRIKDEELVEERSSVHSTSAGVCQQQMPFFSRN
jgi:hypothetical protein